MKQEPIIIRETIIKPQCDNKVFIIIQEGNGGCVINIMEQRGEDRNVDAHAGIILTWKEARELVDKLDDIVNGSETL